MLRALPFQFEHQVGKTVEIVLAFFLRNGGDNGRAVADFDACIAHDDFDAERVLIVSRSAGAARQVEFHDCQAREDCGDQQER